MDDTIFRWSFDSRDEFGEYGPLPAGAIEVRMERCAFPSGAPYRWYRVLHEDAGGNQSEILATEDKDKVLDEANRRIGGMLDRYQLSIWYDLPPMDIGSAMSQAQSELRSETDKWVRQAVVHIDEQAQKSELPVEWENVVARESWGQGRTGHRVDIVLLRVVSVDHGATIQLRYKLAHEKWSPPGLLRRLRGQGDSEVMRQRRIIASSTDLREIGLKGFGVEHELKTRQYTLVRPGHDVFNLAIQAEYRLLDEIGKRQGASLCPDLNICR